MSLCLDTNHTGSQPLISARPTGRLARSHAHAGSTTCSCSTYDSGFMTAQATSSGTRRSCSTELTASPLIVAPTQVPPADPSGPDGVRLGQRRHDDFGTPARSKGLQAHARGLYLLVRASR